MKKMIFTRIKIYRYSNNFVKIYPNYACFSILYERILFSFPGKFGIGRTFSVDDGRENLKISYDEMWLEGFEQFKEFYENFDSSICKLKYENTILLKGYEYSTNEIYDELIIEFKRDIDGVIMNKVNYW